MPEHQSKCKVILIKEFCSFFKNIFRYIIVTSGNIGVLWQTHPILSEVKTLRGHRKEITQVDFNRTPTSGDLDDSEEIITCSYDRVILWNVQHMLSSKVCVFSISHDLTVCTPIAKYQRQ